MTRGLRVPAGSRRAVTRANGWRKLAKSATSRTRGQVLLDMRRSIPSDQERIPVRLLVDNRTMGNRRTVVRNPKDELKTGTLHAMLKQLGLSRDEI